MSSLLLEVGTPCPRRSKNSTPGDSTGTGSDSFGLWDDSLGNYDDTKNIDFTTEIRAPILTGAKPKRRSKASTSFIIHSDYEEKPAAIKQKREIKPALSAANRKTSLLAQPAQRFRPRVSFAPSPVKHSQQRNEVEPTKRTTKPSVHKNNELLRRISSEGEGELGKDVMKKDVRRNTIYIPPEDTTVASVFMGLFSPLKSGNLNHVAELTEINSLGSQIAKKQQAKQRLASSPGRIPLQNSSKVLQESNGTVDIPGKNGGKENIPPGMVLVGAKGKNLQTSKCIDSAVDELAALSLTDKESRGILASAQTVTKPLATKTVNIAAQKTKKSQDMSKLSARGGAGVRRGSNSGTKDTGRRTSTVSDPLSASRSGMNPSINRNSSKHTKSEYPPVPQGITNPSMYDDNWLSHQEVILTQLINGLFDETNGITQTDDPAVLRRELLLMYQSPSFTDLYKRLQSSLLYGALSIPKHVLAKNSRLRHDLGLKRKYIDIWLQTYEPRALKAALETVTGRIIPAFKPSSSIQSTSEGSPNAEKALRRRLEKFLGAFLVQNQDMDTSENSAEEPEPLGNAYRRTVLRSIMLVILLDKAKLTPKTSLSHCLFLASSPYKSSSAVLQVLTRFLLPSCGDIIKALGQLDCQVSYQQHPLEEYEYEVSNLAVDLRDGIRLTRIVELLLYPLTPPDNSCDVTLSEMRLSKDSTDDSGWPLCRRLKFPCLSRTVKMFNVRVALDALASNREGKRLINNIRAEDIVNGHRENTIALLWGLVSKWGLSGLVDLGDLRTEITQLKQRAISRHELETQINESTEHGENGEAAVMLKQWASLLAQLHSVQSSVTTKLGDSKVYECILDEYEGYILSQNQFDLSNGCKASLEDRLRALGCSTQFIRLVSPRRTSHIPDTHSNTGALAFLCSRLLPATKRARAAIVLQNAWRRVLRNRENTRKIAARDIARQCAAVVQTRDRILWAKNVILHWWRMSKSKRRRRATATRRVTHGGKSLMTKTTTTRIPLRCGR
ncbi:hypothetical protein ASPCAL07097 [Aspergillus calidoustus]|uniref:Calponin-homology (CH) domain-containing protein n=1 Tax=Aspergillus calidoustus TaxID=454130 RepID=A0A0U5G291_ASPCI|nr:hypothetical protein ASPCAL07097 [Aspergillus calidoustus]